MWVGVKKRAEKNCVKIIVLLCFWLLVTDRNSRERYHLWNRPSGKWLVSLKFAVMKGHLLTINLFLDSYNWAHGSDAKAIHRLEIISCFVQTDIEFNQRSHIAVSICYSFGSK